MRYSELAAILILAFLFAVNCYRAATQSVVHDEALTWQWYLAAPASALRESYTANLHFLQALLSRLSIMLWGTSEFTLRMPTLLAGAWFFSTVFRLSRFGFGDGGLFLFSVLLLSTHPLVLDFLVAARGYGLALAFLLYALFQFAVCLAEQGEGSSGQGRGSLPRAATAICLSVMANLTMLIPGLVLGVLGLSATILSGRSRAVRLLAEQPDGGKIWRIASALLGFGVPVLLFALVFVLVSPIGKARRRDFYTGAASASESLWSLLDVSFLHNEGIGGLNQRTGPLLLWVNVLAFLLPATVLLALGLGINALSRACRNGTLPERSAILLFLAAGTMVGSALLLVAAHHRFGSPYPADRTGLYFLPLMALCLVAVPEELRRRRRGLRLVSSAYVALGILVCAHFAAQWNVSHFYVWRYDADSKRILEVLRANHQGTASPVRLGLSWPLEPSFNFYRRVKGWSWVTPVSLRRDPHGEFDYWILTPVTGDDQLIARRNLRTVYRGAISGTIIVAARP